VLVSSQDRPTEETDLGLREVILGLRHWKEIYPWRYSPREQDRTTTAEWEKLLRPEVYSICDTSEQSHSNRGKTKSSWSKANEKINQEEAR
jgi:hypothetical protein